MGRGVARAQPRGRGQRFSFEVLLGLPPAPPGGHLAHYRHLPGERVLWVDASGQSAPWYRGVLASWGMEMHHATHLDDAADWLRGQRCHAVFVDALVCKTASEKSLQALLDTRGAAHLCMLVGPTDVLHPLLERQASGVDLLAKPISPQDLNRALAGDVESRRVTGPAARLDGLRLLVADDNEVNRLVASATLEALGAQVSLAVNGLDVLSQLALGRFDAVLMDMNMPQLDGFEATRRLREQERERGDARLPVIAMTAIGPDEAARMRAAGLDGYVGKPIQTALLVRELRAVMARSAADEDSADAERGGLPSG